MPDESGPRLRDTQPPGGGRFDEGGDATRRTRLANERTYLAWWRTGLTSFAVSIGTGKVVPALTKQPRWPYVVVGVGFALLGVAFLSYGFARQRMVEEAIRRGEYVRPDERLLGALAAVGALLGLATTVLVISAN
jgi:putative membrane protein